MSINETYRAQVELLVRCLPAVAKHRSFALKGGTAINLFIHDMPRLSVDIDLTFLPITDRSTALNIMTDILGKVGKAIRRTIPQAQVQCTGTDVPKLQVATPSARIRIEPSPIARGSLFPPVESDLCQAAQNEFELLRVFNTLQPLICTGESCVRRSIDNILAICLTSSSFKRSGIFPMTSGRHSSSTLQVITDPWWKYWHQILNPSENSLPTILQA